MQPTESIHDLTGQQCTDNSTKADQLAMSLIGTFFPNELLTGGNLMEWWGGAFEVATIQDVAIRKVSNILFTFWRVIPGDQAGTAKLFLVSRFVKQSYYDDALVIQDVSAKISGESMEPPRQEVHFVLPLLKVASEYNFSTFSASELDCTTLCAFVLPSDAVTKETVGVRIYHDSDGENRFRVVVAPNRLELNIKNEIVINIEDDISSVLGMECRFSGLSN